MKEKSVKLGLMDIMKDLVSWRLYIGLVSRLHKSQIDSRNFQGSICIEHTAWQKIGLSKMVIPNRLVHTVKHMAKEVT